MPATSIVPVNPLKAQCVWQAPANHSVCFWHQPITAFVFHFSQSRSKLLTIASHGFSFWHQPITVFPFDFSQSLYFILTPANHCVFFDFIQRECLFLNPANHRFSFASTNHRLALPPANQCLLFDSPCWLQIQPSTMLAFNLKKKMWCNRFGCGVESFHIWKILSPISVLSDHATLEKHTLHKSQLEGTFCRYIFVSAGFPV